MATIGKVIKNVGGGIFNRTLGRLFGAGISSDNKIARTRARWSGRSDKTDWRVRLEVPDGPLAEFFDFENNAILAPLSASRGIFWPLTPTMQIAHSANYNAMDQVHSNYPHQAYQNSQIDSMNIIGEFPVQNSDDAKHWVATVNFLRTATKMFFGSDEGLGGLKGNPPPIMHLYGYGDHMFHRVPVVINSFNLELRQGIDYISTKQGSQGDLMKQEFVTQQKGYVDSGLSYDPYTGRPIDMDAVNNVKVDADIESQTWAPTISNISVLVTPIYSRDSIKKFSMKKFVNGELNGKGNEVGFI